MSSFYTVNAASPDLNEQLLEVIKLSLPYWGSVKVSDLQVIRTENGLTNHLLIVKAPVALVAGDHPTVIVRIFGDGTDAIIDREKEAVLNKALTDINFETSKFIAHFANGRIESFIDGKAMDPEDFYSPTTAPLVTMSLAPVLSKLHSAVTSVSVDGENDTITKGLEFAAVAETISFPDTDPRAEQLQALNLSNVLKEFREVVQLVQSAAADSKGEVEMECSGSSSSSSNSHSNSTRGVTAVACEPTIIHADLLCGNIMVSSTTPLVESAVADTAVETGEPPLKLFLIDMEYSGAGAPAYDIANHFNEWTGLEVDQTLYPDRDMRYEWYRHYLTQRRAYAMGNIRSGSSSGGGDYTGNVSAQVWEQVWPADDVRSNTERRVATLSTFDSLVTLHGLLSHLYWTIWAITLSTKDKAPMDYLDYARLRYVLFGCTRSFLISFYLFVTSLSLSLSLFLSLSVDLL